MYNHVYIIYFIYFLSLFFSMKRKYEEYKKLKQNLVKVTYT